MKRIAKFEKVSFEQYKKDLLATLGVEFLKSEGFICAEDCESQEKIDSAVRKIYDRIKLPKRATMGSAGYDFFTPFDIKINHGKTIKMPTGIRVKIDDGWVLQLFPRSGLGFKFRMQLDNTVGIIDSDYYGSDNQGHMMAKLTNDTNEQKDAFVKAGDGYMQGIFTFYGITVDDDADGVRNGGFGSTTK